MKTYNIPTEWLVCSIVEVEADSLDKAIELVNQGMYDESKEILEAGQISDSWTIQYDFIDDYNKD